MKTLAAMVASYGRIWLLKRELRRYLARCRRIEALVEVGQRRHLRLLRPAPCGWRSSPWPTLRWCRSAASIGRPFAPRG